MFCNLDWGWQWYDLSGKWVRGGGFQLGDMVNGVDFHVGWEFQAICMGANWFQNLEFA